MATNYERLTQLIEQAKELIKLQDSTLVDKTKAWKIRAQHCVDEIYGADSTIAKEFGKIRYSLTMYTTSTPEYAHLEARRKGLRVAVDVLEGLAQEEHDKERDTAMKDQSKPAVDLDRVFIVHGHDETLKEQVARVLEQQELRPIILNEQANTGKTIVEKLEAHDNVSCAICLFTPDDLGQARHAKKCSCRARQNVVLEAGYFMGKLGRENVIMLSSKEIEMPSDIQGVIYLEESNWQLDLLKELKAAGFVIDLNKLI